MPGSVPQDLADALLQELRGNAVLAAAFGDTWDPETEEGTQKFFADYSADVDMPYLWILETGETYTYFSPGEGNQRPYLADGQLGIFILAPARSRARQLGLMVAATLNDADAAGLQWTSAVVNPLRFLRLVSASFQPITAPGPGVPAVFARVLTFSYEYEGIV